LWRRVDDFVENEVLPPARRVFEPVFHAVIDPLVGGSRLDPHPVRPGVAHGYWGGISAEGGAIIVGGGGQGQVSTMVFPNGQRAQFLSGGAFLGGPGYGKTWPATLHPPGSIMSTNGGSVLGGDGGVAAGLNFSNATSPADLVGPATSYNLSLGPVAAGLSLDDHGHYLVGVGRSVGGGFGASEYPTYTKLVGVKPIREASSVRR
jgi:hypothetical protein